MVIKKTCIFGIGGFGSEVLCCLIDIIKPTDRKMNEYVSFMVSDENFKDPEFMGIQIIPQSKFNPALFDVVVAVGDPFQRKKIVENLPSETTFARLIHPNAIISSWVEIGEGSIITAGTILTCNIKIGKHAHLNLNTTIGHNCEIGDYFTTGPGANISGNCRIHNCVYFGTGSAVKQNIQICDNVTIGMGGIVTKNITEPGIYFGNPVKKHDPT